MPTTRRFEDLILEQFEKYGTLPKISGGDHDDDNNDDDFKPIESQKDLDRIIGERLKRERRKITQEVRKDLEEEQKTEEAKKNGDLQTQLDEVTKKYEDLLAEKKDRELRDLKTEKAKKYGIPEDQIDRIQGETEDEIEADAKQFAVAFAKDSPDSEIGDRSVDNKNRESKEKSLAETFEFGQKR